MQRFFGHLYPELDTTHKSMRSNTSHHELSLCCGDVAVFAVTAVKAKTAWSPEHVFTYPTGPVYGPGGNEAQVSM